MPLKLSARTSRSLASINSDVGLIRPSLFDAFDRGVVDKLSENLALARESLRAGKIGLLEFNVVRRDLVETRRAFLDAMSEVVEARAALDAAAGGPWE